MNSFLLILTCFNSELVMTSRTIPIKKCTTPKTVCPVDSTSATCASIILDIHDKEKCKMVGKPATCQKVDKVCEDYNSDWGDDCTELVPESANKRER